MARSVRTARLTTLRTRVRIAYAVLAVLGIIGVTLNVTTFLGVLHEREKLSDQFDPAATASQRWLTALVDRETGVRGYALTGDIAFLAPRTEGLRDSAAAERDLRSLLADEPDLLRLVDRLDQAARSWKVTASDPLVARIGADGANQVVGADLEAGRVRFERIRNRAGHLGAALQVKRTASRDELARRNRALEATSAIAALVIAAVVAGTWFGLNRLVLRPLGRLGDDARRVADGDLGHGIAPVGPPELVALATDVEAMRERIIDELTVVEQARVRLLEQAADLERSNQELEQFAYVASHDLQEPLRKVTGFCQLLQRRYGDQLDERADEYIAFAVDGAKRMQVLINDLLAFSRVGRTTTAFTSVDLAALTRTVVDSLSEAITETDAAVDIGPLPTVTGDATLLAGLVQNLLANAIKFRGEDPPLVTVRAEDGPEEWTVTVTDNGIGISPEYAERVFVIFQRLHTREVYEGTGIGLSMGRKIVEFHGGHIWVATDDQRPDTGTTICFTLPHEPPAIDTRSNAEPLASDDQPVGDPT